MRPRSVTRRLSRKSSSDALRGKRIGYLEQRQSSDSSLNRCLRLRALANEYMASVRLKALALSFFTVGYNVLEGLVAVIAGTMAGSSALLGFGLDSFVESLSGTVMIWRFWKYGPEADEEEVAKAEHKAIRLVGYTFYILGAYIVFDSTRSLVEQEEPEKSVVGVVLAILSLIVMPVLFYLKYRLGKSIGSESLVADSKETLACMLLSVALLVGLGLNYLWRIWWADSVAALVIAALVFKEGSATLRECREGDDSLGA